MEPKNMPPVLRCIHLVVENDENIFTRTGIIHLEVGEIVGFDLQLAESDDFVAGVNRFLPFGFADPLFCVDIQLSQHGVGHRLGHTAVIGRSRHIVQKIDVIPDLLLNEREQIAAVHLFGQTRVGKVHGERHVAEEIHRIQIEPGAHDNHFGLQTGFPVEIDTRLVELVENLVTKRDSSENKFPDGFQILHVGRPRVGVHVAPYAVIDPLIALAQRTHAFVRRYGDRSPDAAITGIPNQIGVDTPGAHQKLLFVVEELIRRNDRIGLFRKVDAGNHARRTDRQRSEKQKYLSHKIRNHLICRCQNARLTPNTKVRVRG